MKNIYITSGTGSAPTELAAFDAALHEAGLADANLIHLSSVIPLGAQVVNRPLNFNGSYQGDRIYVVYADMRVSQVGKTAAAGLGWVQTTNQPQWGLFVEHTGNSEDEVQEKIEKSLQSMTSYRTGYSWGTVQSYIRSVTCHDQPVDAIVIAVYKREDW